MKMLNTEEALKKSDEYYAVEINKLREVIKTLEAENARYREALDKAEKALKFYRREFD